MKQVGNIESEIMFVNPLENKYLLKMRFEEHVLELLKH